jgi:hypothetical protein
VPDGPLATVGGPLELIVGDGVEVDVELEVEVDVDVEVELELGVFVDELDEDVFEGELVADDTEVVGAAGASLVGGVDVRDAIGVLEGSDGRLTERDVLGRLEPPPHATINIREMAYSAITRGHIAPFRIVGLSTPHHPCRVATTRKRVCSLRTLAGRDASRAGERREEGRYLAMEWGFGSVLLGEPE